MSDVKTQPKRLVDLNPRWVDTYQKKRQGVMLQYDCPCGQECEFNPVLLHLTNPLDGGPTCARDSQPHWQRTGEDFATLTLSPSVHAVGHWHGHVRGGMVTSC